MFTFSESPKTICAGAVVALESNNARVAAILVSPAANGTVILNADGSFSYSPNPGFIGTDTFAYKATDGSAESGEATVTITVAPVNHAPVAVDDDYSIDEDTPGAMHPDPNAPGGLHGGRKAWLDIENGGHGVSGIVGQREDSAGW